MQSHPSSLGEWMKERRKHLDLTQIELADLVGCSLEMVQKLESGSRRPSKHMAELLADVLQVGPDELPTFLQMARSAGPQESSRTSRPSAAPLNPPNLPSVLTRLIGRDEETTRIRSLFELDGARLVTLTGPPGIGKTRLSLQVAQELSEAFDGGTFFVSLVDVEDARLVTSAIAEAVQVRPAVQQSPLEAVVQAFAGKRALIVLDNFEQVIQAATVIADLLSKAPRLAILVTSREGLNLLGERQYPVPPLALPNSAGTLTKDELARYPAIALFVERAVAVKPDFELTVANANAVTAIGSRLDGLPLAIELVAARVKLMSPQALLERLSNGSALAAPGSRDAHRRHQTLHASISWSYDLLNASEQSLFRRLSVFAGGCTLLAAEAVCNAHGDLQFETLAGIASLVDKSLLRSEQEAGGETRCSMLRVIREFGLQRLRESQDEEMVRRFHAEYYLALAEASMPEVMKPDHVNWLNLLDREMDNMRSAMQWLIDTQQAEMLMRFTGSLGPFCWVRGYIREGRAWTKVSLELADSLRLPPSRARSYALAAAGQYAWVQGDYQEASARHTERLLIARQLSDKPAEAEALSFLGFAARDAGNSERAVSLAEESLVLYRDLGDDWGVANTLNALAVHALEAGDAERAASFFQESLELFLKVGDRWNASHPLTSLGRIAWLRGDIEEARLYFREAVEIALASGYIRGVSGALATIVDLMVATGEPEMLERAIPFAGATEVLLQSNGITLNASLRDRYQAALQCIRHQFGAEALMREGGKAGTDLATLIQRI